MEASKIIRHNIFLSHSNDDADMDFAERLCKDLEEVKQSPFFWKEQRSMIVGEFPIPIILEAARACDLAVVIVSKAYFTRNKLPILELVEIMKESRSRKTRMKIIPLFYGLTLREYKDLVRRRRWFDQWESFVDERWTYVRWRRLWSRRQTGHGICEGEKGTFL